MDYINYLRKLRMIGIFDPWKKDNGDYAEALLVPVDTALLECIDWANQDITRNEFLKYLKDNDILVFSNIDEYTKWKKNRNKPVKKFKRIISEERKNQLREHAKSMRDKLRATNLEKD